MLKSDQKLFAIPPLWEIGCAFPSPEKLEIYKMHNHPRCSRIDRSRIALQPFVASPQDQRLMKFSLIHGHPNSSLWSPAAAALLVACIAGCASPGQPRPPSLNLPETVKDLSAERVGDEVRLHWTTPEKTTDRIAIKGAMTAAICRIANPPSSTCVSVKRLPVQSGVAQTVDVLPPTLTADPPTLLAYRIEILNPKNRSAGPSPAAFAAAGAAPPSVDDLRATPTRDGAMLEWKHSDNPSAVELDRLPIAPDGTVIEPTPKKPTSKASSKPTFKPASKPHADHPPKASPTPVKSPFTPSPSPTEVKLRTPIQPTDAGGTIDRTAPMGDSYRYTAQRVRSVTLGGHALELRSAISSPATVVMRNTFPPHAPTGLEAIPGGATAADRSIDLSWTPNTDPDLVGYNVYRQDVDSKGVVAGTAARLNTTPVAGPAYRDQTAMAGRRYAYRVTAVDSAGNESAPSADVQETLREQ
jgi:hypothetical protein